MKNFSPKLVLILALSIAFQSSAHSQASENKLIEVKILAFNDLHGQLLANEQEYRNEKGETKTIKVGGMDILASYVRIARSKYGKNLLVLDGGDEFQGSLESNFFQGASMLEVLNSMQIDAASIGNHEFDFGQKALKQRIRDAHFPYLSSNLENKHVAGQSHFSQVKPYLVKEIEGVRIGIIGFTTPDTPVTTAVANTKHLEFKPVVAEILKEAEILRNKEKVTAIIVLAHAGGSCKGTKEDPLTSNRIRSAKDTQGKCNENEEIVKVAQAIPQGTVDLIVGGHRHEVMHHWINSIPVVSTVALNNYFHMVTLSIDRATGKVSPALTTIQGPVAVCETVFAEEGHCIPKDLQTKTPTLAKARFLDQEISRDQEVSQIVEKYSAQVNEIKKQHVAALESKMNIVRNEENDLGNFTADLLRKRLHAQFAIVNGGTIRVSWNSGELTYGDVFNAYPFDDLPVVVDLTGEQIQKILETGTSGLHRFFQVSGLKVKMNSLEQKPISTHDYDGNGKIDQWEENRVLSVTDEFGNALESTKTYSVAMTRFMADGGDHTKFVFESVPRSNFHRENAKFLRDLAMDEAREWQTLGKVASFRVNHASPRIEILK